MTAHPIDTEALRKLADAATPGPWRAALLSGGVEYEDGSSSYRGGIYPIAKGRAPVMLTNSVDRRDAEFIAASRTAAPALLDALAAAEHRADEAETREEQILLRNRNLLDAHRQAEARIKAVEDVLDKAEAAINHHPAYRPKGQRMDPIVNGADIRRALDGDA